MFRYCPSSFVLAAVVGAGIVSPASAAVYTWVGSGVANTWADSANWKDASNNPGIPTTGDTATGIPNGYSFTSYNGQSVGSILVSTSGTRVNFNGGTLDTFTFDNEGSPIVLEANRLNPKNSTFHFAEDASWTGNSWMLVESNATLTGNITLTIDGELWLRSGGALELDGLRIKDGRINLDSDAATDALAHLNISLATGTEIDADFTKLGANTLTLDTGNFAAFRTGQTETWEVLAWQAGATVLPQGTYNISSPDIGDADFSALFTNAPNLSINVVPEPMTAGLLGMLGAGLLVRRRRRA